MKLVTEFARERKLSLRVRDGKLELISESRNNYRDDEKHPVVLAQFTSHSYEDTITVEILSEDFKVAEKPISTVEQIR